MIESSAPDDQLRGRVVTLQIIAGGLLTGVVFLLAIVLFLKVTSAAKPDGEPAPPILTYIAFGFLALGLVAWAVVPARIIRSQVRSIAQGTWAPPEERHALGALSEEVKAFYRTDRDKLFAALQTSSIVGWALLEGPAFMGCITYLVEGQPLALAAVAVPLLLMLGTFPTREGVIRWLDERQSQVEVIRLTERT
jgi:hypothetical protein